MKYNGALPSGKAQDFDSCIRWFNSSRPSHGYEVVLLKVYDESYEVEIERVVRDERGEYGQGLIVPFSEIKDGDYLIQVQAYASGDAHISGDASYDGWVVYDEYGTGYFPEDFGAPLKS